MVITILTDADVMQTLLGLAEGSLPAFGAPAGHFSTSPSRDYGFLCYELGRR